MKNSKVIYRRDPQEDTLKSLLFKFTSAINFNKLIYKAGIIFFINVPPRDQLNFNT